MAASASADCLAPVETLRLAEFARACKAATRVVALYPVTHPAIAVSLARVGATVTRLRARHCAQAAPITADAPGGDAERHAPSNVDRRTLAPLIVTVVPDALLLEGRSPERRDGAIEDLAALLHAHSIGELCITADLSPDEWHAFLTLLARAPEDVREAGGIRQVWLASGMTGIELRQIDYAEVLRDRTDGLEHDWHFVIDSYLEGDQTEIDEETLAALVAMAADTSRFRGFIDQLVHQESSGRRGKLPQQVVRLFQALADYVAAHDPEQLDRILDQIAASVPRMTAEIVLALITQDRTGGGSTQPGIDLASSVSARLTDRLVSQFVGQSVARDGGASGRLAQVFHALAPERSTHAELLDVAELSAAQALGRGPDFNELWRTAAELLTTYSDRSYVSADYARELAFAPAQAIDVERVSDDPPERISAWRETVDPPGLVGRDHVVLIDLLALETRPTAWHTLLESALTAIDRLVLQNDVAVAHQVLDAVVRASGSLDGQASREDETSFSVKATARPEAGQDKIGGSQRFAASARAGLDRLRNGAVVTRVVHNVEEGRPEEMPVLSAFCQSFGPSLIAPLAEALATAEGMAAKHLREVLLGFGAAARAHADALQSSVSPGARRTAIDLLRAFGGTEALPDLAVLLDDNEPAVQRHALRAIVDIGTDSAHSLLHRALSSGARASADSLVRMLTGMRETRTAPLFIYILEHSKPRGRSEAMYLAAVEALGRLAYDPAAIRALNDVLYRRDWWAPLRTQRLRRAAARALRQSTVADARIALEAAVARGPRGTRRAASEALAQAGAPTLVRNTA